MKYSSKKAFSLSELLVTLSLVGIMCMTTLSVNGMSNSSCKISETKFSQTEAALKTWEKEVLKTNEIGHLGVVNSIHNEDELVQSLSKYLNNKKITKSAKDEYIMNINNPTYKNYTKIKLDNGVTVGVKYIGTGTTIKISGRIIKKNIFETNLAIIKIDIPVGTETISEAYYLTAAGLKSYNIYTPACVQ